MRDYKTICLMSVVCGGLALTSAAQKKSVPATVQAPPANARQQAEQQAEQNKVAVRQLFEEMFGHGRYELEGQVFDPNCKVHFGNRSIPLREAVAEGKGWRSAAPDLTMKIDQMTVRGNTVNVLWTATGTNTGEGHGLKPTGKHINMRSRSAFRLANGKIVEAFNQEYRPELFRQLGVSKTQAFMFFTGERVLSALGSILPDRIYALLE
jgi:predicted ester cyclase